jgi:hypothetical protein
MNYVEIISNKFPTSFVSCSGDATVYENIVHEGGDLIPTQSVLDTAGLSLLKAEIADLIKAERDRRKISGIKVGTNWFHSDDSSRIQQIGLVMFGANMPANLQWKTLTGAFITMTPTLASQIFQSMAASDTTIFSISENHKTDMMAATNPSTYNFHIGWPIIYSESPEYVP